MRKHVWTLGVAAVMATAQAYPQGKYSLPELESLLAASPAVRISATERQAAEAKHTLATSDLSPKLFVSGTVASAVDPVRAERYTIEQSRAGDIVNRTESVLTPDQFRYGRYGAVVGIRIPLFGSRDVLMKNAAVAEGVVGTAKIQEQVVQMEMLKALRYAYVEYYFRQAQSNIAEAYMETQDQTLKILDSRRNARLLLPADHKSMQGGFATARYDIITANAALAASADKIYALTGRRIDNVEIEAPTLPFACRVHVQELTETNLHPALRLYSLSLENKRRALEMTGARSPDSALTLSQGFHRYGSGSSGNSTALSIDVQFPIGGPDRDTAARKLALSEVNKAEIEYDAQKAQFVHAINQIRRELTVRKEHVALLEQRLESAREAERVTRLRIAQPEGDVIDRLVRSRHALYQAYHARFEAEMQLTKAQIDMIGLGECDSSRETYAHQLTDAIPLLSKALLPVNATTMRSTVHQEIKSESDTAISKKVLTLGWYAWHAFERFDSANTTEFWSGLPRTDRVMLSLTAAQINAVTSSAIERTRLMALLSSAKKRHISVSLLLGDPGWVLPGEAQKMLDIVHQLKTFPFSGIHLDIEESQLTKEQKREWAPGLMALVRNLRRQSTLPIAVSLHPRDTVVPDLLPSLKSAGVDEIAVMQYTTNQQKVVEQITSLMRLHPNLRFSLAQSIEPILSSDESYAKKHPRIATEAWENIALRLKSEPNFAGIIIQSLDDYLNGALNEN